MILRKPDFYDRFQCIASRCTDTCCVGWEIDIDEASLEAYNKVAGAFGERLRANIEDGHFKLLPHDRCPFLDKDNLCEVYQNLGEDALCDICTEHPRFVEVFGDIMERGSGFAVKKPHACCLKAMARWPLPAKNATSPKTNWMTMTAKSATRFWGSGNGCSKR